MGLSTAYLNIHENFTSVGYIVSVNTSDGLDDCIFLSVEEKMDDFFKTDNFEVFKDNETQVLWFILDLLFILDKLYLYKIKITCPTVLFAVKKDGKRWQFRIDDIPYFEYTINETSYENHSIFVDILKTIYVTIEKKIICEYLKRLMGYAKELKDAEHPYYIKILISEIQQKITTI